MSATAAEIDDYLSRYAGTLAAFDAGAAAGLWGTPGMILDDRSAGVLDSREEMARGLERSYPLNRELGAPQPLPAPGSANLSSRIPVACPTSIR
ncbi:hypothetical protein ACPA54_33725 [Uniformispora flossi]|uniref:hypothetical protein n=1 Tax=Uniformispora flossi TaxID=3390723 RepID=UPI003C2E0E71